MGKQMNANVVAVAGVDGLFDSTGHEAKSNAKERKMFSTQGYGALNLTGLGPTAEQVAKARACKAAGGTALWNMAKRDYDLADCSEVLQEGGWWGKQTTTTKTAIVVGGVAVAGIVGYLIYQQTKKPASYTSNRRRKHKFDAEAVARIEAAAKRRKRRK